MWNVDVSLFQFHSQLTWAVFFLNGDKTIYGRYGSRGVTGSSGFKANDRDVSIDGFRKAMTGALELHEGYPANKASLAGKTGQPMPWRTPEASPQAQKRKQQPAEANQGKGCIHCHEVQDYEFLTMRESGKSVADRNLWTYPMPDTLGLTLDVNERAKVTTVKAGSPADKAGFKAGDRIASMEGQPVISIADVQWVLHTTKEPGSVKAEVDRAGRKQTLTLALAADWRRGWSFADNLSLGWVTRGHIAGMKTQEITAAEKQQLGLAAGAFALKIVQITPDFVKERNQSPKQQGLQNGDVLIEVDGMKAAMSESDFLAYLCEKKKPGEKLAVTYVRGGKSNQIQLDVK